MGDDLHHYDPDYSITSSARASSKGGIFEAERPPARACPSDQLGAKNLCQIRWTQLFLLSTAYRASRHFSYLAARALYMFSLTGSSMAILTLVRDAAT